MAISCYPNRTAEVVVDGRVFLGKNCIQLESTGQYAQYNHYVDTLEGVRTNVYINNATGEELNELPAGTRVACAEEVYILNASESSGGGTVVIEGMISDCSGNLALATYDRCLIQSVGLVSSSLNSVVSSVVANTASTSSSLALVSSSLTTINTSIITNTASVSAGLLNMVNEVHNHIEPILESVRDYKGTAVITATNTTVSIPAGTSVVVLVANVNRRYATLTVDSIGVQPAYLNYALTAAINTGIRIDTVGSSHEVNGIFWKGAVSIYSATNVSVCILDLTD